MGDDNLVFRACGHLGGLVYTHGGLPSLEELHLLRSLYYRVTLRGEHAAVVHVSTLICIKGRPLPLSTATTSTLQRVLGIHAERTTVAGAISVSKAFHLGAPGWLSWKSMGRLISGSSVRAPALGVGITKKNLNETKLKSILPGI